MRRMSKPEREARGTVTGLDLDAIEARASKRSDPHRGSINDLVRLQDVDGRLVAVWRREFVDNAHDDVAALVARVRELEAEIHSLEDPS